MAEHPRYVGTDRPIFIGDTAHSAVTGQTGTVIAIREGDATIQTNTARCVVGIEYLRPGPTIELTIRPTRDDLLEWVRHHDKFGDMGTGTARTCVVDAIPADLLAELRAEIEAERQS